MGDGTVTSNAALHLAHVHQAPVRRRQPKRTGGRDGPRFAEFAHQIYQDDRADSGARQMLLALAYALTMAPLDGQTGIVQAASAALGTSRGSTASLRQLMREDVPRYEPPGYRWGTDPLDRLCSGPRVRFHPDGPDDFRNRLRVCGAPARDKVVERDLQTGWHKNHWFCPRHQDHLDRVRDQLRGQSEAAPAPIPNRGGLLPCYFDSDWTRFYRWALGSQMWEPPVYGVCADAWPLPGRSSIPQRARLRLVAAPETTTAQE